MIPGGNLLAQALTLLGQTEASWREWQSRTLDGQGLWVDVYATAKTITGSWQAVQRDRYENLGLDFQKRYYWFYTCEDVRDIGRDETPDTLDIGGKRYNCISAAPWYDIDGWTAMLCVETGAAS